MAHIQQQILDAISAALVDLTDADGRVYVDSLDPKRAAKLPYILIAEAGEQVDADTLSSDERLFDVQITCALKLTATHAAESRAFGLAVEKLIAADEAGIGALCGGGHFITSSQLQQAGTAEEPYAARVQSWRFIYRCDPEDPEVAL